MTSALSICFLCMVHQDNQSALFLTWRIGDDCYYVVLSVNFRIKRSCRCSDVYLMIYSWCHLDSWWSWRNRWRCNQYFYWRRWCFITGNSKWFNLISFWHLYTCILVVLVTGCHYNYHLSLFVWRQYLKRQLVNLFAIGYTQTFLWIVKNSVIHFQGICRFLHWLCTW